MSENDDFVEKEIPDDDDDYYVDPNQVIPTPPPPPEYPDETNWTMIVSIVCAVLVLLLGGTAIAKYIKKRQSAGEAVPDQTHQELEDLNGEKS